MRIVLEVITPDLAKKWLEKGMRNRSLIDARVRMIAADIIKNRYRVTGDPIRLDTRGKLIDGQHRLAAVVLSNRSIGSYVAYDCDPKIIPVIDTGKNRTLSDVLKIKGYGHSPILSAIIRKVWQWENGRLVSSTADSSGGKGQDKPSRQQELAIMKAHPELEHFAEIAQKSFFSQKPNLAFCYWVYSNRNRKKAVEFFTKVATQEDMKKGDPAWLLIRKLQTLAKGHPRERGGYAMGLIFRAMQAHLRGEKLENLRPTKEFVLD